MAGRSHQWTRIGAWCCGEGSLFQLWALELTLNSACCGLSNCFRMFLTILGLDIVACALLGLLRRQFMPKVSTMPPQHLSR
jgi:hypothetical protein